MIIPAITDTILCGIGPRVGILYCQRMWSGIPDQPIPDHSLSGQPASDSGRDSGESCCEVEARSVKLRI